MLLESEEYTNQCVRQCWKSAAYKFNWENNEMDSVLQAQKWIWLVTRFKETEELRLVLQQSTGKYLLCDFLVCSQ
ncbi:unnamed protein product [Auanema sp. JU1783]|nr:unnamed protein product [Auanema sp. JU1783]